MSKVLPFSASLGLTPKVNVAERKGNGAEAGSGTHEGFDPVEKSRLRYLFLIHFPPPSPF